MERYANLPQPAQMSNQEFGDITTRVDDPKDILHLWPRPKNLLSLLTVVYGNDIEKIVTWLGDPNTEVDEYLTTWNLSPQIARLDMFRRAAIRTGTTFELLCAETRALVLAGGVPAHVQSAAACERVLAKSTDEECTQ